ncbi:Uncharacterised protein [Shigella sonnei]|nr:hypothetical protein BIT35_28970 [Klebsiella pneumoniae]CSP99153.1 Uncharacterised protein [Shigella sonnei]CSQ70557.1 Uncharacterised protein [Shigella sonnei]CSR55780.1 Uncharacterised protein [Shigella sonnei]CST37612.1 Uncharacterised protein [Shigella sonnei]
MIENDFFRAMSFQYTQVTAIFQQQTAGITLINAEFTFGMAAINRSERRETNCASLGLNNICGNGTVADR